MPGEKGIEHGTRPRGKRVIADLTKPYSAPAKPCEKDILLASIPRAGNSKNLDPKPLKPDPKPKLKTPNSGQLTRLKP